MKICSKQKKYSAFVIGIGMNMQAKGKYEKKIIVK